MRTLPQIEVGNLVVWIEPFAVASKRGGEAALSTYLEEMAVATRCDGRATPILGAMLDAYRSLPVPQACLGAGAELINHLDARTAPII